jgi:hypothetical protein
MRSLREIKKSIGHARVESKPGTDKEVLQHLLAELATVTGKAPGPVKPHVNGRIVRTIRVTATTILALLTSRKVPRVVLQPCESGVLSAADLLTVGCLNAAFRRGGLEAVDRQYEMAARGLGTRPERISVRELIRELNL